MSLTPRNAVTLGTPYEYSRRGFAFSGSAILNTFNTPTNSWNTIVFKKVIGGNAGDTLRLNVFKGSLPDDPNDPDDDNETVAKLDQADLLDSADVVLDADIPAEGILDVQFDFNNTFSRGNLGATYTVVFEQFDNGGSIIQSSKVYCEDRTGVSNFTSPDDTGQEEGESDTGHGFPPSTGGAGNLYLLNNSSGLYTNAATADFMAPGGTGSYDPCMPLALFERSPYGTSRNLTGSLTSSTSLNII